MSLSAATARQGGGKRIVLAVCACFVFLAAAFVASLARFIWPEWSASRALIAHSSRSVYPTHVVQALLAAEEPQFPNREHASTLTAQFVKARLPRPSKSVSRVFKELLLRLLLEATVSRHDLINAYLDDVYLGRLNGQTVTGFPAGARVYFDRTVADLSVAQAAMLAGMIRSPNSSSPVSHPARALERRNLVLQRMREDKSISAAEYERAIRE